VVVTYLDYMGYHGALAAFLAAGRAAWAVGGLLVVVVVGVSFLYLRERARLARLDDTATTHSERSQRLQAVLELGTGLRASHSVEEVARMAGDAVHDTLNYRENAIYLLDPDDDTFVPVVVIGGDESYDEGIRGRRIPLQVVKGLLKEEFRTGNVYFVDHRFYHWTAEEQEYFPSADFDYPGPGHFHPEDGLFVPLLDHDDRVIGLFDLYNPVDGRVPAPETFQVLEIFANVTVTAIENARYSASLQRLAITDGLTGLHNHRHFQEILSHEVERGLRYGSTFTLLMMDLDFFKNVNDRLGHQRGDDVLRRVSEVITVAARSSDFVARYGGEEFVMILPETPSRQAEAVAQRVRQGVKRIVLEVPNPPDLSISIGVADFPFCGKERESLIAAADAALMFAKRSGRDMVTHFSAVTPLDFDSAALEGLTFRLEGADLVTLEALAAAVDARDTFDRGHTARVVETVEKIIGPLGLDESDRDIVRAAARIYDVGKLVIPIEVLNRTDGLGDVEREAIRRHPDVGRSLLESTMKLAHLLPVVGHHHECWDGSGYPGGLKGEEIPLAARVIAICDAYQAMVSDRPYRKALSGEEVIAELRAGAGTQFDPDLVERFIAAVGASGV
jgi:diguanylate cyclase (GGDEF)-like protein